TSIHFIGPGPAPRPAEGDVSTAPAKCVPSLVKRWGGLLGRAGPARTSAGALFAAPGHVAGAERPVLGGVRGREDLQRPPQRERGRALRLVEDLAELRDT